MSDPGALLIQKQAALRVPPRSSSFSSTVMNRFFSDNSLARKNRVIEVTKRRQAKAREKALTQDVKCRQMQEEYEEAMRLKALKEEREALRNERRLQHAAAELIQYIWRKYIYEKKERILRENASKKIYDFITIHFQQRKRIRRQASLKIIQQWRNHQAHNKWKHSLVIISKFLWCVQQQKKGRKIRASILIQRKVRHFQQQKRQQALFCIKKAVRYVILRRKIHTCAKEYRALQYQRLLDRSASLITRFWSRFAMKQKILRTDHANFDQYFVLMNQDMAHFFLLQQHYIYKKDPFVLKNYFNFEEITQEDTLFTKKVSRQEQILFEEIDQLEKKIVQAKKRKQEEKEKWIKFPMMENLKKQKEEEMKKEQLQLLEMKLQKEIRLEIEKEFETTRRNFIRDRKNIVDMTPRLSFSASTTTTTTTPAAISPDNEEEQRDI